MKENEIKKYRAGKYNNYEIFILKEYDIKIHTTIYDFYIKKVGYADLMYMFGMKKEYFKKIKIKEYIKDIQNEYIKAYKEFLTRLEEIKEP